MADMDLGNLLLTLGLDDSSYRQSLENAKRLTVRTAKELEASLGRVSGSFSIATDTKSLQQLEKYYNLIQVRHDALNRHFKANPLKPVVDHRPLVELNKHYDLKQAHHNALNQHFKANPIRPEIDLSALDLLNARLQAYRNNPSVSVSATAHITSQVTSASVPGSSSGSSDYGDAVVKAIDKLGDRLERAIYGAAGKGGGLFGALGRAVTSPLRMAGAIGGDIAQGAFMSIGEDFARGAVQGSARRTGLSVSKAAQLFTKKVLDIENSSAAFLAEFLRSGDVGKASQQGWAASKGGKALERLMIMKDLATTDVAAAAPGSLGKILQNVPNIEDILIKAYTTTDKKTGKPVAPSKSGKEILERLSKEKPGSRDIGPLMKAIDASLEELRPKEFIDEVLNPLLVNLSKTTDYIGLIQAYRTRYEAEKRKHEVAPTLPNLKGDESGYLNVIGGAMWRKGRGGNQLAASFDALFPSRRILAVDNPDTDPHGQAVGPVGAFLQDILRRVAPGIANDPGLGPTVANALTMVGHSFNPAHFSRAAADSLANILAAREAGVNEHGTVTYSLGGREAEDLDRVLKIAGITSPIASIGYPDINAAGRTARDSNMQAYMIDGDPLAFVKQVLGIGGMGRFNRYETDGMKGQELHAYKHLFKNKQFVRDLYKQLGVERETGPGYFIDKNNGLSDATPDAFLQIAEHAHEFTAAGLVVEQLMSKGSVNPEDIYAGGATSGTVRGVDYFAKLAEVLPKFKQIKSGSGNMSPRELALARSMQKRFIEPYNKVAQMFAKEAGDSLAVNKDGTVEPEALYGFLKYEAELSKYNAVVEALKKGKSNAESEPHIGSASKEDVASRIRPYEDALLYFSKKKNIEHDDSRKKLVAIYESLLKLMRAYVEKGSISEKDIAGIHEGTPIKFSEKLQRLMDYQVDTDKFKAPDERLRMTTQVPDWVYSGKKGSKAAVTAYNKMVTDVGADRLPNINDIRFAAYGMSGAASLITDNLVFKNDLESPEKIASANEVAAYERLSGRFAPLMYENEPGKLMVTERIHGTPAKDALSQASGPAKFAREQLMAANKRVREISADLKVARRANDKGQIAQLQETLKIAREVQKEAATIFGKERADFNVFAQEVYRQIGFIGGAFNQMGVAHNDLASGNVFLTENGPMAIDLGNSTINPTNLEKLQDKATAYMRAAVDQEFYGLLDLGAVHRGLTKGWGQGGKTELPEARTPDMSLLPKGRGAFVPLGSDQPSYMEEIYDYKSQVDRARKDLLQIRDAQWGKQVAKNISNAGVMFRPHDVRHTYSGTTYPVDASVPGMADLFGYYKGGMSAVVPDPATLDAMRKMAAPPGATESSLTVSTRSVGDRLTGAIENITDRVENVALRAIDAAEQSAMQRINSMLTRVPQHPGMIDVTAPQYQNFSQLGIRDYAHLARLGLQDSFGGLIAGGQRAYGALQGVENVALSVIPGGHAAKAVGQQVILPMAVSSMLQSHVPGLGGLIGAGGDAAAGSINALIHGAAGNSSALQAVGHLPWVGQGLAGIGSGLSGEFAGMAGSAMANIAAGNLALGAAGGALNALTPTGGDETKRAAESAASRLAIQTLNALYSGDTKARVALPSVRDASGQLSLPAAKGLAGQVTASMGQLRALAHSDEQASGQIIDVTAQTIAYLDEEIERAMRELPAGDRMGAGQELAALKGQLAQHAQQLGEIINLVRGPRSLPPEASYRVNASGALNDTIAAVRKQAQAIKGITHPEQRADAISQLMTDIAALRAEVDALEQSSQGRLPRGAKRQIGTLRGQLTGYEKRFLPEVASLGDSAESIAANVGKGVSAGVERQRDRLSRAGVTIAQALIHGAEEKLEIKSPSRVFLRMMGYVADAINSVGRMIRPSAITAPLQEMIAESEEAIDKLASTGAAIGGGGGTGGTVGGTAAPDPGEQPGSALSEEEGKAKGRFKSIFSAAGHSLSDALNLMVDRLYVFNFAQQLKTVFDITNRVFSEFVEGFAGANNELANQFVAFGKNAAIGAAGIYGLVLIVPRLMNLSGVVLEVAKEFENLNRVVANIEGSQSRGARSIAFMKGEVNRLSADLRSSYKNYTQLLAATKNTPLEGVDAQAIFSGIQSAATANALTPEDASLTFLAASQMVNKNVISMEELRQQMGERLPSAFQTAARAMGLTTSELSKLVETGQLTAEEFMPKFAAQLSAENSGSIAGASKTAQAALNRFNNEVLEMQAATGSAIQPIQKFVLNTGSGALSVIRENMQSITKAAIILGLTLAWRFAESTIAATAFGAKLLGIDLSLKSLGMSGKNAFGAIASGIQAALPVLGRLALQFTAIAAVGEIIKNVTSVFSDGAGSIRDYADAAGAAAARLQELQETKDKGKSTSVAATAKDLTSSNIFERIADAPRAYFQWEAKAKENLPGWAKNLLADPKNDWLANAVNSRTTAGEKRVTDLQIGINDLIDGSGKVMDAALASLKNVGRSKDLEVELRNIQAQRRSALIREPGNADLATSLRKQEESLKEQLANSDRLIRTPKAELDAMVISVEKAQKDLEDRLAAKPGDTSRIDLETYNSESRKLTAQLTLLKQAQEKVAQATRGSVDEMMLFANAIADVIDRASDMGAAIDKAGIVAKTQISQMEALGPNGGYTEGQAAFQKMIVDQEVLRQKLQANMKAVRDLRAILNTQGNIQIFAAMGIDPNQIGESQIKTLGDRYKDAPKEKALLENLSRLKALESETLQLSASVAQADAETATKLRGINKGVADYYRTIERQAAEVQLSIKGAELEARSSGWKGQLQGALKSNQQTFIGEYVSSLIEMFDALMEPVRRAIEFNRKQKGLADQLADTLRQGDELSRGLPGGAFGGLNVAGGGGLVTSGTGAGVGSVLGYTGGTGIGTGAHLDVRYERGYARSAGLERDGTRARVSDDVLARFQAGSKSLSQWGITSEYGPRHAPTAGASTYHEGVDFGTPDGTPITVTVPIKSTRSYDSGGAGGIVTEVVFADGVAVNLLHMNPKSLSVRPNLNVGQGSGQAARSMPAPSVGAGFSGGSLTEEQLFSGYGSSLAARVIGMAEGTRTASGGFTKGYYGHGDPGNGAWNVGSFSAQGGLNVGNNPEASDKAVIDKLLRPQFLDLQRQAQRLGVKLTPKLLFNYFDAYNQSPLAAREAQGGTTFFSGLGMLKGRENDDKAIAQLRNLMYTSGGQYRIAGLTVDEDQGRRMAEVNRALKAAGLLDSGSSAGISPSQARGLTPPTTGATSASLQMQQLGLQTAQAGQAGIQGAQSLAMQNVQQEIESARKLTVVQDALSKQRAQMGLSKADAALDAKLRELIDRRTDMSRKLLDLEAQIGPDTPERQHAEAQRKLVQEGGDTAKDYRQQLKNIREALADAESVQKVLADLQDQGALPEEMKGSLDKLSQIIPHLREEQRALTQDASKAADLYSKALIDAERKFQTESKKRRFEAEGEMFAALNSLDAERQNLMTQQGAPIGDRLNLQMETSQREINRAFEEMKFQLEGQVEAGSRSQESANALLEIYQNLRDIKLEGLTEQVRKLGEENDRARKTTLREKDFELQDAKISRLEGMGLSNPVAKRDLAMARQNAAHEEELYRARGTVKELGLSNEEAEKFYDTLNKINDVKLDSIAIEFSPLKDILSGVQSGFQTFFTDILTGAKSADEAFADLGKSILNTIAQIASQMLVQQLFGGMFGGGMGGGFLGGLFGGGGMGGGGGFGLSTGIFSLLGLREGGLVAHAPAYGYIPNFAEGGPVGMMGAIDAAMKREGHGAMLAVVNKDEYVLTAQETNKFFAMGLDKLLASQSGHVPNFAQGGPVSGAAPSSAPVLGSQTNLSMTLNLGGEGGGNKKLNPVQAEAFGKMAEATFRDLVAREKRPGGSLYGN